MAGGTVKPTSKKPNKINESDMNWLESFGIKRSLTDYEQEARDAPLKEVAEASEKSFDGYSMSKEELDVTMESLKKLYNSLESKPKKELTEAEKELIKLLDTYKAAGTGTGFLNGLQKAATDTSKPTAKEEPQVDNSTKTEEPKTTNSEGDLSSSRDVGAEWVEIAKALNEGRLSDAQKLADQAAKKYGGTSEPKVDNSTKTEETVTPETGKSKVEGEPQANTEQAQTTQEPKSEAKQTSTESSEMTPEEVYDYLSDKKNFAEADTYFSSGKDGYVTKDNKRIPKSWFETFKENKDKDHSIQHKFFNANNKNVFTASLRDKGLLEDPKKEPSREEVERTLAEADAKAKFDKWIDSKGNKFRGIIGKHPWLTGGLALSVGVPIIMKAIDAFTDYGKEQAIEDMQVPDEEFWGNNENDDYNGEPIEPGNVAEQVANAAQETEQAGNNAEEQAAQALQENLPQGKADTTNQSKGESPAATNASTPASTAANTTESAPTQGLPPVVTRNTPSTNPDSSGMTYSQRVESGGKAPQAGSMAYNANNPDMVTAGLIDAMNQNSQAGSDAIGYGDLYDQNFIDFWAKRNPNLAFGVSQGRK